MVNERTLSAALTLQLKNFTMRKRRVWIPKAKVGWKTFYSFPYQNSVISTSRNQSLELKSLVYLFLRHSNANYVGPPAQLEPKI